MLLLDSPQLLVMYYCNSLYRKMSDRERQILYVFTNLWNLKKVKSLSRVQLFATPWTVAWQAPPSMGFSKQEYWSGLPFPSPGDLPRSLLHCRQTLYV